MPTSPASTRRTASTKAASSAKSPKKTVKRTKAKPADVATPATPAVAAPSNSDATPKSNSTSNSTSVEFAAAARLLTRVARNRGLIGPSFRCPPRLVGVDRSIRRTAGAAVVSVRLRGRPFVAVLADMIEGVVVANRLTAPEADRLRSTLWQATGADAGIASAGSVAGSITGPGAGSAAVPGARVA